VAHERSKEHLLAEIEDVLMTMPPRATIRQASDENLSWLGRAAAAVESWNFAKGIVFNTALAKFNTPIAGMADVGYREMKIVLHQARHSLRMETVGPANIALPTGAVFDYFDEVRKVVALADVDAFFVDPYLDAEFVSRYLPFVRPTTQVRLMTTEKKIDSLIPAVELFSTQNGLAVSVRTTMEMHDRYVFVDKRSCFQSGASFKDGAKKAPTTLTEITDAFKAVLETYEKLWASAHIRR